MDRPASQVENVRPSGIKPPSKLPALAAGALTGRTLLETSQSDLNARNTGAASMMPPPTGSIKHKLNGLPEPTPKRKTLVERAAESHPRSQSQSTAKGSKGDSAHHTSYGRGPPSSASGYRTASGASSATSSGIGRPSSRQYGLRQNGLAQMPSVADLHNAEDDDDDAETGVMGKRKGTPPSSLQSHSRITLRKTRQLARNGSNPTSTASAASTRSQHPVSALRASSTSSDAIESGRGSSVSSTSMSRHSSRATSGLSDIPSQQDAVNGQTIRNSSLVAAFDRLCLSGNLGGTSSEGSSTRPLPEIRPPHDSSKAESSPSKIPKFSCTPAVGHTQPLKADPSLSSPKTPSPVKHKHKHKYMSSAPCLRTPTASARRRKDKDEIPIFLTKEKLTPTAAWDTKGRLEDMETLYASLQSQFASAAGSKAAIEESLELYKSRVQELSQTNKELTSTNRNLTTDLERARNDLHTTTSDLRQARRDYEYETQEIERKHARTMSDANANFERVRQTLKSDAERIAQQSERDLADARRDWEKKQDDAIGKVATQYRQDVAELRATHSAEVTTLRDQIAELQRSGESRATESASEVQALRDSTHRLEEQLEAARATMGTLRSQLAAAETRCASLEQEKLALVSKAHFLEGNQEAQSLEFTSMSERLQEAVDLRNATIETLRKEETLRRRLNATILELRGNIRVFVRLRPLLSGEDDAAKIDYPDRESLDGGKEMTVYGSTTLSATGKERKEKHDYAFDRVFSPGSANAQVFDDCRDLIQSVVDGYNVSILSYGQTGSGKTYGMSGPDGIIPSSIALLLEEMHRLQEKGWEYAVEANFVEVYNETLNDLLGDAKTWDEGEDMNTSVRGKRKEKHEIHHDAATGKTTVTNLSSVTLWPPPENDGQWPPAVSDIDGSPDNSASYTSQATERVLEMAAKNRRVAATKANERSSRSHSVFMLTLKGRCGATGESSEGTLNLVDLAGSERLKQSGAEGSRMKETQAINKSLSALGDVIAALGAKKGDDSHIPYRNSKLTYLLQSSLGGTTAGKSSRTLMLLHLSPLQAHWQESRSSLLFGSKVHGTHIGAAKKR